MAFTKEQQQAINEDGKNIIVSAGAGSGKTQVLTQRILRHIKDGVDIRDLLILTFTKDAAREMKNRVLGLLKEKKLNDAISKIDEAYITTFDSFALSIVKKYGYKLNLDKNIKNASDNIIKKIKDDIIEEIFTEYYDANDEKFYNLIRKYTVKNDLNIRALIKKVIDAVELMPDSEAFFVKAESKYYSSEHDEFLRKEIEELSKRKVIEIKKQIKKLLDVVDLPNKKIAEEANKLLEELIEADNYEEYRKIIRSIEFPNCARNSEKLIKDTKQELTNKLKEFTNYFGFEAVDEPIKEYNMTKDDGLFILDICHEVMRRLKEFKIEHSYFTFADIAIMAIDIVKKFPLVREEIKNKYHEILIDEYQDTSDLQEAFISYIAKNNVYMVGDIKQSIYRFRNANPYIFKKKYNDYSNLINGMKIDLNKNFRSRKETIEDFNLIFNLAMTDETGDASYAESHQMSFGLEAYDKLGAVDYDCHMEIKRFIEPEEFDPDGEIIKKSKKKEYDTYEAQMNYIALDIQKRMKYYKVLDKEEGFRPIRYSDICILISDSTKFVDFLHLLDRYGIPACINCNKDLKNSLIAKPLVNLYKLILYKKYDEYDENYKHAVVSVLRSFIYNYSDDVIFDIINNKKHNKLIDDVYSFLKEYKNYSINDTFDYMLNYFGIYEKILKVGNILEANVEINKIKDIINDYVMLGNSEFEAAANTVVTLNYSNEKNEFDNFIDPKANMVKIMTIHKSKGLEFPLCYFPFLDKHFRVEGQTDGLLFDVLYGFSLNSGNDFITKKSFIKKVIVDNIRILDISEKVRLFYVALTRAREKMILTYYQNGDSDKISSFKDILGMTNASSFTFDVDPREYINLENTKENNSKTNGTRTFIDNKYSFKGERLKLAHASMKVSDIIDNNTRRNINLGLKMHEYLECLDFHNLDFSNISDEFIKNKLISLFKMPLFAKINEANVYQEYEFYYQQEHEYIHGIIDLFLVFKDEIYLIDYKLSNTNKREYEKQLKIYKDFLTSKFNLPVRVYLVSLLNQTQKELNLWSII